jgi:hypothetical protein
MQPHESESEPENVTPICESVPEGASADPDTAEAHPAPREVSEDEAIEMISENTTEEDLRQMQDQHREAIKINRMVIHTGFQKQISNAIQAGSRPEEVRKLTSAFNDWESSVHYVHDQPETSPCCIAMPQMEKPSFWRRLFRRP